MLKKLLKVGVVMSLVLASTNLFAQDRPDTQRYGAGSHLALGGAISYNQQFKQGGFLDWRSATNAGVSIFGQKKFRHDLDLRFRFAFPSIWNCDFVSDKTNEVMSQRASLTGELLYSLNNGWLGYDPDRRFSWYVFFGGGLMFSFNQHDVFNGIWGVGLDGGTGISYRFTDHSSCFLEYELQVADIPDVFKGNTQGLNGFITLGYFYDWGASATDQAVMAQKSMLSQENFSALNSQVSTLENQVNTSKANEKKLENRIAELENQLREARTAVKPVDNSEADRRLKEAVDKIKADQLNFYAMPFSVQYDVNEWQVSEDQIDKVKAVAQVMKDTDAKFMVVGFADYSGSDAYNQKLSERRANEVKRLLKSYGVPEDKITVEAKGKSAPFGDVKLPVNRRVSFYRSIE